MGDEGALTREAEKGVGVASEETQAGPGMKAFARPREFWIILAFGIPLGIVLAFGSLAFLGVTDGGVDLWFDEVGSGWFDGELWWVAVTVGAGILVGGGDANGETTNGGYFVEPTLFTGVSDEMRIAREEIFGPVLVAMPYDDLEEVARRANDTEYGLAAGVWTRDLSAAHRLAGMLKAGSIYINNWGAGDPAAPFGGYKASGIGREKGRVNLDAYLETKTVFTKL